MFDPLNQNGDDEIDFPKRTCLKDSRLMRFAKYSRFPGGGIQKARKRRRRRKKDTR